MIPWQYEEGGDNGKSRVARGSEGCGQAAVEAVLAPQLPCAGQVVDLQAEQARAGGQLLGISRIQPDEAEMQRLRFTVNDVALPLQNLSSHQVYLDLFSPGIDSSIAGLERSGDGCNYCVPRVSNLLKEDCPAGW